MLILFDQGVPTPLRRSLVGHEIKTAFEMGWSTLANGDLLAQAESLGFDVLVTTDRNLGHQQNLRRRCIAILALSTTSWPRIRRTTAAILEALSGLQAGAYVEVEVP